MLDNSAIYPKIKDGKIAINSHRPDDSYDVFSYRRAINRACEKLGIEPWNPNQLRHTFATQIRKKFGLDAAQVALGHEHADVTQVYAEKDLAVIRDIAKSLG